MGGSIHIFGKDSSIIDTVFVCRRNGEANRRQIFNSMEDLTRIVRDDLGQLRLVGVKPTTGDIRCITFGHLTRMAIGYYGRHGMCRPLLLRSSKDSGGT
jgi:hypothetical protein